MALKTIIPAAAALALTIGCSAATQQKTVSALAIGVVSGENTLLAAYDVGASVVADQVEAEHAGEEPTFEDWCRAVQELWDVCARIHCALDALMDVAVAGQVLIDASDDSPVPSEDWTRWLAAAGPALSAVINAWTAIDGKPPEELVTVRDLFEGFLDDDAAVDLEDCVIGCPPGCGGVE